MMTALALNAGTSNARAGTSTGESGATGTSCRAVVGLRDGGCVESAINYKCPLNRLANSRQPRSPLGVAGKVMGGCPWTEQS